MIQSDNFVLSTSLFRSATFCWSHKILIKYIEVCGCHMRKCEFKWVEILLLNITEREREPTCVCLAKEVIKV